MAPALADVSRAAWRKPAARQGAVTRGEGLWAPWEGLGPPSPPRPRHWGVLAQRSSRGHPGVMQHRVGRRTRDPGTQTPRGPPCPPPLPSPGLTAFLSGSACSPPGAGAAVALAGPPGVRSWGAVRGVSGPGVFLCLWTEPPFPPPPLTVHLSLQQPLDLCGQQGRASGGCTSWPELA